jgi:cell wall-associated NlpC family hydrolase
MHAALRREAAGRRTRTGAARPRIQGYHARLLGIAWAVALLAAGCGRAPRPVAGPPPAGRHDRVATRLRETVERCRHDPEARKAAAGLDCSAFVAVTYRDLFGLELPRASEDMARAGRAVERGELRPGDLVFFRPRSNGRHVGFYVGGGEFGHVSQRSGVRLSRLSEPYWRRAYWTARRVLPE